MKADQADAVNRMAAEFSEAIRESEANVIEMIAQRTADLVIERLHPSVRNPPPDEPSPFHFPPSDGSSYQPRLDDPPPPPRPISPGQIAAFNGKLDHLARLLRVEKSTLKKQALRRASDRVGRDLESTKELTFVEASDVLDELESRIEQEGRG